MWRRKLIVKGLRNRSNWFCLNGPTNMQNTIQLALKWQFFPKNCKNSLVARGSTPDPRL